MGIKITKTASVQSIESRFELNYKKERTDIAKLLSYLKNGHTIETAFDHNISISTSVRKMLINNGLIDSRDTITPNGEEFIKYPYKNETERGIYSLYLASLNFGLIDFSFAIKMERKLANDQRTKRYVNLEDISIENEFALGINEIGVMNEVINKSESFVRDLDKQTITFDLSNGTYTASFGEYKMGNEVQGIVKKYLKDTLEEHANYIKYNPENDTIIIKELSDFTDEDLANGTISKLKVEDINFISVPFVIENVDIAKKYAYFYLYTKIENGNYYTIDEMNEVFQNEVLSKDIISASIKEKLLDFKFKIDGFETHLSPEKYSKLSYRLKVIKSLLDLDAIKESGEFSSCKSYKDLLKILSNKVPSSEVKNLYMVMGYAFAKNKKNNIITCINEFKKKYQNITIVNKSSEGKVNEDEEIKKYISTLSKDINIINRPEIDELFHDRYLIFELNDNTYKTFLVTCEIGSIFNLETSETKGTLFEIPNADVVRSNKSIINMIKEG